MKKFICNITSFFILLIVFTDSNAQSNIGFNYQTIIRDAQGNPVKNQIVALRISILNGSATGTVVYSERQEDSTNNFGLLNLVIGEGNKLSGNFSEIEWNNLSQYLKIEVDLNGGTNYTFLTTNKLQSVPYSKYAEKSHRALNDQDTSKTNELQELIYQNDSLKLTKANSVKLNRYVPDSNCILGMSSTPPAGYQYSGNTVEMNGWENKARMLSDRYCATSAVVNGKIYVIGGYNQGVYNLNQNEEYDPATNCWSVKASMPTGRSCLALGVVNNKIYAIGGLKSSTSATNVVEEYDPSTNTWSTKASMLTTRANLACGVINNKIYVVGGNNQTTWYSVNEEYNPATNTWSAKASMVNARGETGAAVFDNQLFVFGGYNNGNTLCYNEQYNPATDQWITRACMPKGAVMSAAATVNDQIYVIGGFNHSTLTDYALNQVYSPKTNSWQNGSPMITARHGICASAVENKIYVFGGAVYETVLAVNEVFDPLAARYYVHCRVSKQ